MGIGRWVMAVGFAIAIGFMTIVGFPLHTMADVNTTVDVMAETAQPDGAKIFASSCAACHIGGTNVLVAQKTLEKEALEKFAMDSIEAIQTQVTNGKNAMPAFSKKLSEPEIAAVADYVLRQAQAGW